MEAEELRERLAALEDLAETWAGWWTTQAARTYAGPILPPLRRTEELLGRRGLEREAYRRRAVRRERTGKQPILPFSRNLRLPLG